MHMSLKQKLKSIFSPRIKLPGKKKGEYIVIDFRDEYIKLPDGTMIPKSRILQIDTERKVIVYLDSDGSIKEVSYMHPQIRIQSSPRAVLV